MALRTRKSMVAACFDYTFAKRITTNPQKEARLKKANKEVNTKRASDLGLAKRVKESGAGAAETSSQEGGGEIDLGDLAPMDQEWMEQMFETEWVKENGGG